MVISSRSSRAARRKLCLDRVSTPCSVASEEHDGVRVLAVEALQSVLRPAATSSWRSRLMTVLPLRAFRSVGIERLISQAGRRQDHDCEPSRYRLSAPAADS